jgi:acetylornithine deacetylase/succinyl-diaminopimelate desuccinylase-like protein
VPDFTHLDEIITRHRDEQIAFLQALVRARSANPFIPDTSDPSEPIERAVAYLIHDKLRAIGLEPEFKGESKERPNVIATLRGSGKTDRALILNGHMDTVMPSPLWTFNPFGAEIRDGRLLPGCDADAVERLPPPVGRAARPGLCAGPAALRPGGGDRAR